MTHLFCNLNGFSYVWAYQSMWYGWWCNQNRINKEKNIPNSKVIGEKI